MSAETRTIRARKAALVRHHPGRAFPEVEEDRFVAKVREAVGQLAPISEATAERVAQILRSAVRRPDQAHSR